MRARNGNIAYTAGSGNDSFDFTALETLNGPNGTGYGIDYTNRGGTDHVTGTRFDDSFTLSASAETIDGAGGNDTVDYSLSTAGVNVDLNVTVQNGGYAQGDRLISIENVTGSDYKDTLTGNSLANVLMGHDGNDTLIGNGGNDTLDGGDGGDFLDGGTGNDTLLGGLGGDRLVAGSGTNTIDGGDGVDILDYNTSTYGVLANLSTGKGYELNNFNGDFLNLLYHPEQAVLHDTISNVEYLSGSAFGDVLYGDDSSTGNKLFGNDGNDFIYGRDGGDYESGGKGNDVIGTQVIENMFGPGIAGVVEDTGDDTLSGDAGDDILVGGGGADRMDGGDGFDTVDYSWSPEAVMVDLNHGTGSGTTLLSWAKGDTYVSIEKVIGSAFADILGGSVNGDTLDGGDGKDTIYGFAGDDTLLGGRGDDTIMGGDGNDDMTGGADVDTFIFIQPASTFFQSPDVGDGHDVIHDFTIGQDRLGFMGATLQDLGFSQVGADTVVTYDHGNSSVTLEHVQLADLMNSLSQSVLFQ